MCTGSHVLDEITSVRRHLLRGERFIASDGHVHLLDPGSESHHLHLSLDGLLVTHCRIVHQLWEHRIEVLAPVQVVALKKAHPHLSHHRLLVVWIGVQIVLPRHLAGERLGESPLVE